MTKSAYTPGDLLRDVLAAKKQTANAAAMEIEARGYGASGSAQSAMSRMMNKGIEYFELVPLNPDYPVIRSDMEQAHIIGPAVEHRRFIRR